MRNAPLSLPGCSRIFSASIRLILPKYHLSTPRTAASIRNNYNKSVFSYLRTLTSWHCPHSPAAVTAPMPGRYLLTAMPTAGNLQQGVCCCRPCCDRRMDGRTPYCFIQPAPQTMHAVPITMICASYTVISIDS